MYLYNGEYGVATDENGLYYMRARYYNSEIKRFVNQDVLTGTISDSPTMNRYAYVNGNPISLADPFGLSPMINWSSAGHTALSFLGLLTLIPTPVTIAIGVAANVINAIWYFAEGNTFQGVCSLLCALPGIGNAIGKIGAVGSKVASISGSIAKSLHIIGNGGFVATGFYSIGKMGYNNWQRYVVGNETYTLEQAGADLLTGALSILSIYGGGKGLGWDQAEVPTKLKGCINDVPLSSPSKQEIANQAARQYNQKYKPVQRAKSKGLVGVTETKNGGISFRGTSYVYKVDGEEAIVSINATGNRSADFSEANLKMRLSSTPRGYVWHHVDDYVVKNNTFTVELVTRRAHRAAIPHSGACAQYDAVHGPTYNK